MTLSPVIGFCCISRSISLKVMREPKYLTYSTGDFVSETKVMLEEVAGKKKAPRVKFLVIAAASSSVRLRGRLLGRNVEVEAPVPGNAWL